MSHPQAMDVDQIRNAAPGKLIHLDSAHLPENLRMNFWHDVYGEQLFNFSLTPVSGAPFGAQLSFMRLPGISLTAGRRTHTLARIERRHLAHAHDMVMLIEVTAGALRASQRGTQATAVAGEAMMMLTSEMAEMELADGTSYTGIYLPRAALAGSIGRTFRSFNSRDPKLRLLSAYAGGIRNAAMDTEPDLGISAARHLCELTSLLVTQKSAGPEAIGSIKAARFAGLRSAIAAHLANPALSAGVIAARAGISEDYVRKLFRESGTSFATHVMTERLRRASVLLQSHPAGALSISQIAYDVGFNDISYFNRCFRRHFGMSPSDWRMQKPS